MKQTIRKVLVLAAIAVLNAPAFAATISVTAAPAQSDGPINTRTFTSSGGDILNPPSTSVIPGNGTAGVCTLREAMMTAEGLRASTAAACENADLYCPFYRVAGSTTNISTGECDPSATATAASADEVVFANSSRGEVKIGANYTVNNRTGGGTTQYRLTTLPEIKNPVSIRGLGPDQTVIRGEPTQLAQFLLSTSRFYVEKAIVSVHPDLADAQEVKFENLTIHGTRVHNFLSGCASAAAGCNANEDTAIQQAVNFSGITMDSGGATTAGRKKLTISNARMVCNRRGRDSDTTLAAQLPVGGGAIALRGFAALTLNTSTFSNNVSEFGPGGAIFAQARDNASPELTVVDSRFDADAAQACTDDVFALFNNSSNTLFSCKGTIAGNSACPATGSDVYRSDNPGNFAGSSITGNDDSAARQRSGAVIDPVLAADAASNRGVNGGAVAVDAINATPANIGAVVISGSRFLNSQARGDGGALSLQHVARSGATQAAINITNTLFTTQLGGELGNVAAGNGGAVAILGNSNLGASAVLEKVSFSFNRANDNGGAFHYTTQPGAPIDFSIKNVRMGLNQAGQDGGAIYADDNGVDDSGILNIRQATFDGNSAARNGGAIFCGATKNGSQFTNLTLSGNVAARGGGLLIGTRCHVSVNNNTIFNNTATSAPSAGCLGLGCNGGGGIFVPQGSGNGRVDVRNSIIANNHSFFDEATQASDDFNLREFDNQNPSGPDCSAPNNAILRSAGFNFIGTNSGCGPAGADDAQQPFRSGVTTVNGVQICLRSGANAVGTGDIVGNSSSVGPCAASASSPLPQDPRLRVLADNDGPDILGAHNFTHHPETNSRVINSGGSAGCFEGPVGTATTGALVNVDERERARGGSAGRCDMGSVEVNGGLVPTTGNLVVSAATNVPTNVKLTSGPIDVEILRLDISAPTSQPVTIQGVRLRKEDVESAFVAGSYDSVRGIQVVVVNETGQPLDNPLYQLDGPVPFDSIDGTLQITFNTPLALQPGQSVLVSVKFRFDASLVPVAQADTGLMLAAAGGLGVLSFAGMIGLGAGRRRALLVAVAVLGTAVLGGCGGNDDGDEGPQDNGVRGYRLSARQITFDTDAQSGLQQSITVVGDTINIENP